jgi:DNA (cytosine-5)-methyltransferase 1
MDYLSVCSGIEAVSVAWHAFARPMAFAEIDPFAAAVLACRFPAVPNLGDMTTIADRIRRREVPAPSVLVGGTPCQAFSIAGKRASLDDARGQLSLSFVEVANAIDSTRFVRGKRACAVVWENVPGCLSTNDNAFGCFLAALAGEDAPLVAPGGKWSNAGYVYGPQRAIAWRVLDAQYFGVPQRRARVFVVASAASGVDPIKVLFECEGMRRDFTPGRQTQEEVAGTVGARIASGGKFCAGFDVTEALQSIPAVDVCPTLRAGVNSTGGNRPPGTDVDTADSLLICVSNAEGANGLPFLTRSNIAKTVNNQTPLLAFDCRQKYGFDVRRLTPIECERLQGFPDGWTNIPWRGNPDAPDSLRYAALGNSMAVPVMRWIGQRLARVMRESLPYQLPVWE